MNDVSTQTKMSEKPLNEVKDVRGLLQNDAARKQLAAVAAKHMNPERMMRIVANAIRTTPQLQEAHPLSFLGALMNCAALGLEPNTQLGHAYLIPFKNNKKNIIEVQLIIGYKGFIDLARRSGQLRSIHADVVYSDDFFEHEYGSNQRLHHRPGPRKGKKIGAYCHIKVAVGNDFIAEGHVFMSAEEIIAVREASQGYLQAKKWGKTNESPWIKHEDRMWSKTVVRRLANSGEMPMSVEFMQALETDDSRVDYASCALDPDAGTTTLYGGGDEDGDGDMIESKPVKEPVKEIEKPKPQTTMAKAKEAAPAEGEKPTQDTKEGPKDLLSDTVQAEDVNEFTILRDEIFKALEQSGDPAGVRGYYDAQLQFLETAAPAIFAQIQRKLIE